MLLWHGISLSHFIFHLEHSVQAKHLRDVAEAIVKEVNRFRFLRVSLRSLLSFAHFELWLFDPQAIFSSISQRDERSLYIV